VLTSTLLAYASSNLNVTVLSQRLSVHVNTAHYRPNKIAEQTQRDLRKLDDVLELVIAVRLAEPLGDRPPGRGGGVTSRVGACRRPWPPRRPYRGSSRAG
jgi:hypothetical protein